LAPHSDGLGRAFTPGRSALIAYVMAGFPDRETSLEALRAVARSGADLVEIGVPYADPLADGPVIVSAADAARAAAPKGFGLAETIDLAREFIAGQRAASKAGASGGAAPPVALMTYLNPMLRMGLSEVARRAADARIEGFIVPDMPPEAAAPWLEASRPRPDLRPPDGLAPMLDTVFLAAPTSTPDRLALIGRASRGFVYCVSSLGVTGERDRLPDGLASLVARVRAATPLPVAVGFGVGTSGQVADVARIADGVVVGSAIVRRQHDPDGLAVFVEELSRARV
jgi:tryptophan synthase alpha chain